MVGIALAPTVALAGGGHGGRGGGGIASGGRQSGSPHQGFRGHHGFSQGFRGHHGFNQGFKGHGFNQGFKGGHRFHGFKGPGFWPFFPWGAAVTVWAPPLYYGYAAPAYYPPPPVYYAPAYSPPAVYGPPASGNISVAPSRGVVQYPNGRYELSGDGITTPYSWLWIPNPPPPPPPPPAAPPAPPGASPGEQPTSSNGSPAHHNRLYRWSDEQGVVHWTNRLEAVPTKYRMQPSHPPLS
jgi:hypothetical protein